jgi:proton-translocating NADH-quinone oxidoreductase chain N
MWPTSVMEVLFAGAMLSLFAETAGRAYPPLRSFGAGLVAVASVAASIAVLASGWAGSLGSMAQLQPVQSFFASLYVADRFTAFMAFTVLVVALAVSVYALRYFAGSDRTGPFFALMLTLTCSLVGVISAGDFITLFLFWEGMSISGYGLVAFGRSSLSVEASVKYFFMAGIGSLLALYGMATIYSATGSMQLQAVLGAAGSSYGQLGVAILLVGLGVEAAVVPLHTWLPDVYAGASLPVSALISGAVTGTGVFALAKVLQPLIPGAGYPVPTSAIPPESLATLLGGFALATMVVGNLSALAQLNLRKILSFSSVAQTGYMLAALSTLSVPGLVAAVFTIWNHGLLKSDFFMILGKDGSSLDASSLDRLRGAGRADRRLGFLYASSSLAMVGAPPFGLFWSEVLVVQSLLGAAGQSYSSPYFWLALAVVLNMVMSIGYYFRVINTVVFGEPPEAPARRPLADLVVPASLMAASVVTGLVPFLILGAVL